MRLSLAWVCLLASVGSTALVQEGEQERVQPDEPQIVRAIDGPPAPPAYSPITDLEEVKGGDTHVRKAATTQVDNYNHGVDVVHPDSKEEEAYASFFHTPSIDVQHPPKLREVIHIRDKNIFSDVSEEHPNAYPFDIYNATGRPVDLVFVNYALRATKLWLNKTDGQEYPDINIGGHTEADIDPISDPHIMIMVNHVPAGARSSIFAQTIAVTNRQPGALTRSFIKHTGPSSEPFMREAIATEICQSMVDVAEERLVPGMERQQEYMQQYAGSFNKPALHDLDLASQESVCNGLGNFVTAAYEDGHGLSQRVKKQTIIPRTRFSEDLSMEMRWIDYDLYRPEQSKFLWLAKRITDREYNEVITGSGNDSPTADFYRHHNFYLPY